MSKQYVELKVELICEGSEVIDFLVSKIKVTKTKETNIKDVSSDKWLD